MNTQDGSHEAEVAAPTSSPGKTILISAALFAACFSLYFAEQRGFRVFDDHLASVANGEPGIPSPLEIITVLSVTSLGVCAGLVSLISAVGWFVRRLHRQHAVMEDGCKRAAAGCVVH